MKKSVHVSMVVFICVVDRNSSVSISLPLSVFVYQCASSFVRLLGQKNVIIKIVTVAFRQNGRDKMHFIWKLTKNCTTKTKKERTNVY